MPSTMRSLRTRWITSTTSLTRRTEREYVPEGMEGLLADDSLDDYVWLWIKDSGPNGFRQYLRDGGYPEAEVAQAFLWARTEWGMNTPPHIAWLK